ncbi:Diuretic hormone receptor [Harpegnathos saltator]|uniref:Diuretic hormone receptor n=1 Tax=Harpegnathos saltator TaxID=610380 RepID=E2BIN8_HARSA|nr:Diuretic hormone receptor [Harpegnathos saltator]
MASFAANGTKRPVGDNYALNVFNYNELNESLSAELHCLVHEHQDQISSKQEQQGCEVSWDTVLCWPRTPPGTLATIPCFEEFNGILYDNSGVAQTYDVSQTPRRMRITPRGEIEYSM